MMCCVGFYCSAYLLQNTIIAFQMLSIIVVMESIVLLQVSEEVTDTDLGSLV